MTKFVLTITVLFVFAANLLLGSSEFSFFEWFDLPLESQQILKNIVWENRLPRTFLAALAGVGCALVGLILQTIFNNPLAGPTTLGINSGASLGVAFYYFLISALDFVPEGFGSTLFSIFGALLFLILMLLISLKYRSTTIVLISGIMMGYLAYSLIEILVQSSSAQGIKNYVFWGMGSFNAPTWGNVLILLTVNSLAYLYYHKNSSLFNLYLLGEDELKMAGKNIKQIRWINIMLSGVVIGISTGLVGPLAFIGIAVPNFLKITLKTLNHKTLIPYCAILGAGFAIMADLLSRGAIFPFVFPVNALLSLMAFPILIILLLSKKHGVAH